MEADQTEARHSALTLEKAVALIPVLWGILAVEGVLIAMLQHPWMVTDSRAYLELARNLSGPGFGIGSGTEFTVNGIRPPGYPWILNILHIRAGFPLWSIIGLQLAAYLGALWIFAYRIIREDAHRVAFLSMAVIYFFPFFYSTLLLSEALATLFVAMIVMILLRAREAPTAWLAVGLLLGLGGLIRSDLLPIGLGVALVAFVRLRTALALRNTTLAMIAALLVLLPYMIWNQAQFGRFTPKPAAAMIGQSLWLASWESELDHEDMVTIYGGQPTPAAVQSGYLREYHETTARGEGRGDVALSEEFLKVAKARMKADPLNVWLHSLNGTWRLFTTAEYPLPWLLTLPLHLLSLGTIALAVWGVGRGRVTLVPLVVLLAVLIPHLPLHTEARYTAPLRPILLFYAAAGLWALNAWATRRW